MRIIILVMAILMLSKYPCQIKPLKLVCSCLAVIGAAINFGALSVSSLQNEQNTKSIASPLLLSMGSLGNRICFYCLFPWLKWIDDIYELKIRAVYMCYGELISQSRKTFQGIVFCTAICLLHYPFIDLQVVCKQ